MDDIGRDSTAPWADACAAAAICAVAPDWVGGIHLRARHGPTRTAWLTGMQTLAGDRTWWRIPPAADDGVLFGGLDIAASLATGRAVISQGVLSRAGGGVIELSNAERCVDAAAARIAACMDRSTDIEGFALIALDEGAQHDERAPGAIVDRLALHVVLDETGAAVHEAPWPVDRPAIAAARARLNDVEIGDTVFDALCEAATALGIGSLRAPIAALTVARIAAALDGRREVVDTDVSLAARLVLGPRAHRWPTAPPSTDDAADAGDDSNPSSDEFAPSDQGEQNTGADDRSSTDPSTSSEQIDPTGDREAFPESDEQPPTDETPSGQYADLVLEAVQARVSEDMRADVDGSRAPADTSSGHGGGRRGVARHTGSRGRPAGTRAGMPDARHRLDVMATLRAAAPWQKARGRTAESPRLRIRADDFRVRRYVQPEETATLFVVDASGSSALHRLAETKGAIELLLVDCYVRRDRVGLIAFRGRQADTLLPPTRSLTRARRALVGLPGGGPTPLAAGLDSVRTLAEQARRDGLRPRIVLLTDGRGNIARDGRADRATAERDTVDAARALRLTGFGVLVVDTSPRPRPMAERLAGMLGGRYLPLPQANAARLSDAVRQAAPV